MLKTDTTDRLSGPPTAWSSLKAGFLAGSPLLIGIIPFGVIYGASARSAGLSFFQSVSMSLLVFAGSAQLFFVNLWASKVAVPILVLTCLALNLRLLIYGASIGLNLGPPKSLPEALSRSYFLTDESYAVSTVAFLKPNFSFLKVPFYLGSGLPTWLGWQSTCILGYLAGSVIPPNWPIGLAVPLIFLALLISILRSSSSSNGSGNHHPHQPNRVRRVNPKYISAGVAGLSAILLNSLPLNLGLIIAVILGVAAGLIFENRKPR
ncbi:MAG: AzlC family ABC transporter permease [Deltaproteobacteria bacterium]|jgi:predicted branched-subunit amino acid permease|nr:AzlC family ABC transporter permease [Deltaproteobacteria bacterium]